MLAVNTESLGTLWKVIVGVCILAGGWVSISIIFNQLRPFSTRRFDLSRRWPWIMPRPRWARTLARLMRVLARGEEQLSRVENNALLHDIRDDLNRVMWSIWVQAMSYIALHSKNAAKRSLALRNLSQVQDTKTMDHVMDVIKGVLTDLAATPAVTDVAKAALKELQERASMMKRAGESTEPEDQETVGSRRSG